MADLKTKSVFCANEQTEVEHAVTIDGNGEWLFTCNTCGRDLKFSSEMSGEQVKAALETHRANNAGQVNESVINAKLAELD